MERVFQVVAVVLAGLAAYFFWTGGSSDHTFAAGVAAIAAAFLSYRFRLKARLRSREEQEETLSE